MYRKLYVFLVYVFTILLPLYVCLNINVNTFSVNTSFIHKKLVKSLIPQGWAFFTKSPRDLELSIYNLNNKEEENLTSFQVKEYFGICRKNRLLNTKLIDISKNIDERLWVLNVDSINIEKLAVVTVEDKILKGEEFIISKYFPLPYSWYKTDLTHPKHSIIVRFI